MKQTFSFARQVFLTLLLSFNASWLLADEGMFLLTDDAPGADLREAIVSLDFIGTGSIISHDGLLITNHHCAYSDLHALSTPEKNYLEEGLRTHSREEEIPIKDKTIQILKQVLDVTDEVRSFLQAHPTSNHAMSMRKLSWNLEKKYEEQTGLSAQLASMWGGSKYYIYLYQEYKDVRLVAAPPVCLAAFGGDIDNWQWPQQKCDFALYRVYVAPDGSPATYAPENVPAHFDKPLNISVKGPKEKDYTMIIGYPGSTDRYSSSFKIRLQQEVILPLANAIRGEKMRLMKEAMNADPQVRLHYADKFFSLSNYQELQQMQEACCKRFDVISEKQQKEKALQEWIDADSLRRVKWGRLLPEMDSLYRAAETTKYRVTLFQETMVRATVISIFATRLSTAKGRCEPKEWEGLDMDLERKIFELAVRTWYEKLDTACMGAFHKALYRRYGKDYAAMSASMWAQSPLTDGRLSAPVTSREDSLARLQLIKEVLPKDSLSRFFLSMRIGDFQRTKDYQTLSDANRRYKIALYEMYKDKGVQQYPDANSTLRVSYGHIGRMATRDVKRPWYTTPDQILKKYNPKDYDFSLREDVLAALKKAPCKGWNGWARGGGMKVDFITDNDITGGNSGSPVLNARGELIGLAFDGNAESLASDVSYTPGYNKCVCVDIRYALWVLDAYMGMDHLLQEMLLVR